MAEERDDRRVARLMALVANVNRGKKGKPYKEDDFIPRPPKSKKQTWMDQKSKVEQLNKLFGGRDLR